MNVTQRNVLTHGRRTAHQTRNNLPISSTTNTREIVESNVGDVDSTGELRAGLGVDVEVALVEHDGPVDVVDVEVDVGDVVDVAVADVFAGPGFEARAVLESDFSKLTPLWRRGRERSDLPAHSTW